MGINIIIDIVFGILSALIIIKFTMRGFLRSVLDSLKVPVAALLAYVVRIPFAKMIDNVFLREGIVKWVRSSLQSSLEGEDSLLDFVDLYKSIPKLYEGFLSKFGLGDVSTLGSMESASDVQLDSLSADIGEAISMFLSTIIAVVVLFVIIVVLLSILVRMTDGLLRVSAVKIINRLLGLALGVLFASVLVWALSFLMEILVGATNGFGGHLTKETLDKSMFVGLMKKII